METSPRARDTAHCTHANPPLLPPQSDSPLKSCGGRHPSGRRARPRVATAPSAPRPISVGSSAPSRPAPRTPAGFEAAPALRDDHAPGAECALERAAVGGVLQPVAVLPDPDLAGLRRSVVRVIHDHPAPSRAKRRGGGRQVRMKDYSSPAEDTPPNPPSTRGAGRGRREVPGRRSRRGAHHCGRAHARMMNRSAITLPMPAADGPRSGRRKGGREGGGGERTRTVVGERRGKRWSRRLGVPANEKVRFMVSEAPEAKRRPKQEAGEGHGASEPDREPHAGEARRRRKCAVKQDRRPRPE